MFRRAFIAPPDFWWDFRGGALHSAMSSTRASAGWVEQNGLLVQKSTDQPRYWIDPDGAPWGLLSEMQSTNNFTYSQALAAAWTPTNLTATDNAQTSPDGTANATTIREDGATTVKSMIAPAFSLTSGNIHGFSIFAKNISGSRWLQINLNGNLYANFQPSTGSIGSASGIANLTARQLGNGWWRFSGHVTVGSTSSQQARLYMVSASSSAAAASYAGDSTSTLAVWGAQFDTAGVGVTSYIPTAGSTVTRAQDILTMSLGSMPGWDGTKGGVLLITHRRNTDSPAVTQMGATLYADANNFIRFNVQNTNGQAGFWMRSGGSDQVDSNAGAPAAINTRTKMALSWGTARVALFRDGAIMSGAASGAYTLPTGLATLYIGCSSGGQQANGIIESFAYYKGARADDFVKAVSR